uniref:Photosystem II protein Z n=1 Tax=Gelidium kathyanniae TaxID=2483893 RepID=A0A3G2QXQ2_9FLOR|nr:photosystem II protein Z [Gelidium kathyanniae]AYO27835.1 photosystem II protein Z [Gelidium kathyanniae]
MNELNTPVIITRPAQIPAPVYIKFFDFSHCSGEASVTGMPITNKVENTTKINTSNCTMIVIMNILKNYFSI